MTYSKHYGGNGMIHAFVATDEEMLMLEVMPEGIYLGIVNKCVEAWLQTNKESVLAGVSLEVVVDRAMTAAAEALKDEVIRVSAGKMDMPCLTCKHEFVPRSRQMIEGKLVDRLDCLRCGISKSVDAV